jgi:hypothetical protein
MEYYALKLLKSQVPYLGKKWKSSKLSLFNLFPLFSTFYFVDAHICFKTKVNMKVISAIYLRCFTSLKDDWISGPELNGDSEESKVRELSHIATLFTYSNSPI